MKEKTKRKSEEREEKLGTDVGFRQSCFSNPLKNPIYCGWLVFPSTSFSPLDDLNMARGHSFGHLGTRALSEEKPLILVTNEFFNGPSLDLSQTCLFDFRQ